MDYYVGPEFKGAAKHGSGKGIVDDQGQPVSVGQIGKALNIQHIHGGVGERFAKHGARVGPEGLFQIGLGGGLIHKGDFNAQLFKSNGKEVERAAVNAGGAHHMVAALGHIEQGEHACRLTGRGAQRANAAFKSGDFLLHGVNRGIAKAGIKKARFGKIKKFRHFGGGGVLKGSALHYGQNAGFAIARFIARVQTKRFRFHAVLCCACVGNCRMFPAAMPCDSGTVAQAKGRGNHQASPRNFLYG